VKPSPLAPKGTHKVTASVGEGDPAPAESSAIVSDNVTEINVKHLSGESPSHSELEGDCQGSCQGSCHAVQGDCQKRRPGALRSPQNNRRTYPSLDQRRASLIGPAPSCPHADDIGSLGP
jgi:hypothetical protein